MSGETPTQLQQEFGDFMATLRMRRGVTIEEASEIWNTIGDLRNPDGSAMVNVAELTQMEKSGTVPDSLSNVDRQLIAHGAKAVYELTEEEAGIFRKLFAFSLLEKKLNERVMQLIPEDFFERTREVLGSMRRQIRLNRRFDLDGLN